MTTEVAPYTHAVTHAAVHDVINPGICHLLMCTPDDIPPQTAPQMLLRVLCYGIIPLVSLVANTVVAVSILKTKAAQSWILVMVLNLAISDVILATYNIVLMLPGAVMDRWVFGDDLCRVKYSIMALGVHSTMYTLMLMSVHRYVLVVHNNRSLTIFRSRFQRWLILSIWLLSALTASGFSFIPGPVRYRMFKDDCHAMTLVTSQYMLAMQIMNVMMPSAVMPLLYAWIFIHLHINARRVQNNSQPTTSHSGRKHKRVAVTLCVLYSTYVMTYMPIVAVSYTVYNENVSLDSQRAAYILTLALLHLGSAVSPFLYVKFFKQLQKPVADTLMCGNVNSLLQQAIASTSNSNSVPLSSASAAGRATASTRVTRLNTDNQGAALELHQQQQEVGEHQGQEEEHREQEQ